MRDHPALHESTVLTHLRRVWIRGTSFVRQSETLGEISRQSRTLGRTARQSRTLDRAARQSRFLGVVRRVHQVVRRTGQVVGRVRQFVEEAWVYRWLTADPDPDVVVIDLRETWTVGPWLALGRRAFDRLRPAVVSSRLFALWRRISRTDAAHSSGTDRDER